MTISPVSAQWFGDFRKPPTKQALDLFKQASDLK